jgi:hypothetical protein
MSDHLDELKDLHRKMYVKGQEAVADEVAAKEYADRQELYKQGLQVAAETIELANEMAKDGDPHKQELAARLKTHVVGTVTEVMTGRPGAEGARGAQGASPFSPSGPSTPSGTSLPGSTTPKGLPHEPTGPPRRKRGRPPKEQKP